MSSGILVRSIRGTAACLVAVAATAAHAQTCYVNVTSNQQAIDGFGFSTAWCPLISSAQGAVLFGTGSGQLGFSLLRCRIDPNQSWSTEKGNATVAHSYGGKVLGTAWTPPASMKSNNNTVAGTLSTAQYGSYASFLHSAASTIGLDYVSFQNEPDANVTYESCSWTGATMQTFCANNATAIGKPVVMPEAEGFNTAYSDPTLNSTAVNNVSIIAGHLYGKSPFVYSNALNHSKHVWMTEHYINGTDLTAMMNVAKEVSDCMNDSMSAYFWWWIMPNDAGSFINGTTVDYRGYALGQFAHWVRPGKVRCATTYNPQPGIYVTAFHNNGLVIVALNTNTSYGTQSFTIQNASGLSSATPYQTCCPYARHMTQLSNVAISGNVFTFSMGGQTVTTFTIQ